MTFDSDIHQRRSIRLRDYNYADAGAYFVTICTFERECLFGTDANGDICLNLAGQMVATIWETLVDRFQTVQLDQSVVMPNHFHGIILMDGGRGESCIRPMDVVRSQRAGDHKDRPYGTQEHSLGRVLQAFKSLTTNAYITGVKNHGWPPFSGRLWQRNYYERIIRDERELSHIREYIIDNPAKWDEDENHPTVGANLVFARL